MKAVKRHRAALLLGPIAVALCLPIVCSGASFQRPGSPAAVVGGAPVAFDTGIRASLTPSGAVLAERRAFDLAQSATTVGHLSALAVHVALLIAAVAISRGWSPHRSTQRARYANRDPPVLQPT